jgi:glycosyltransferase involved in cell wall biosynthesis
VPDPSIAALVRCRDEERGIGRLIDALRAQTTGSQLEIVVVDSGSRDGTLGQVTRRGITAIEIAPQRFSYGRALNVAAAAAKAPICVAISAHALPTDTRWAARMLAAFEDERVACAFGERVGPDLRPLNQPLLQDAEHAAKHPFYGYSNSAGGFRRRLWEQRPFDETLAASEDKEWAWHWLRQGMLVRLDPALSVFHSHADEGPVRTYKRSRWDVEAIARFHDLAPAPLTTIVGEWWGGPHMHRSNLRARLDPRRVALLAGRYQGLRRRTG